MANVYGVWFFAITVPKLSVACQTVAIQRTLVCSHEFRSTHECVGIGLLLPCKYVTSSLGGIVNIQHNYPLTAGAVGLLEDGMGRYQTWFRATTKAFKRQGNEPPTVRTTLDGHTWEWLV